MGLDLKTLALSRNANKVLDNNNSIPQPDWDETDSTSKSFIKNKPQQLPASDVHEWAKSESKPNYTKEEIGLDNADNTSDMDKPVSKAQQDELDKKVDKTTVATSSTLGLVKSGTDITVDSNGNVSVNDNSHKHTVSNISDLTATATELNVLDGITASTEELNYSDGVKSNIQTQLDSKAPTESPTLTGAPKAPTAIADTNNTQIATTAFTQTAISNHNTSSTAHEDIRDLISALTTRLNALADSDDTTLDQLSEIVAYIKSNRSLIENVTNGKVNVSDIVDDLTSTATDKPLSAKQGKTLNDLITELTTTVNNKVDKVSGKGLSTNDYTTTEKNKLAGIASGAEVNVQPDWNVTDANSDAYIKNKPNVITKDDLTVSNYTVPQPAVDGVFTKYIAWVFRIKKYGKVVNLVISIEGSMSAVADFATVVTIPEGCRPSNTVIFNYVTQNGTPMGGNIGADGKVKIFNNGNNIDGYIIRQNITYIID